MVEHFAGDYLFHYFAKYTGYENWSVVGEISSCTFLKDRDNMSHKPFSRDCTNGNELVKYQS